MNNIVVAIALALVAVTGWAQVAREPTIQQQLLTTCNYEANVRDLKGGERSRFVSGCLAQGRQRQQEVLRECNAEARFKQGIARRDFLAECQRR